MSLSYSTQKMGTPETQQKENHRDFLTTPSELYSCS